MSRLRHLKPSGSMLVALLALVMATTGSAVAASLITSKQIKDGTITTKDISKKARTALKGQKGASGATGASGLQGAKGDKGDKGDQGIQGIQGVQGERGPSDAYNNDACLPAITTTCTATVSVPAGTYVAVAKSSGVNSGFDSTTAGHFTCILSASGSANQDFGYGAYGPGQRATATTSDVFTIGAGGGTITNTCNGTSGSTLMFRNHLTAINVATLH